VPSVPAAPEPEGPDRAAAGAIEDLISTIEDPERRAKLVGDLKLLLEARRRRQEEVAPEKGSTLVGGLAAFFDNLSSGLRDTAVQLVEERRRLPERGQALLDELKDPATRGRFIFGATAFAGILLAAALAAILTWLGLRRLRATLTPRPESQRLRLFSRLSRLLALTLLGLLAPMAFVGAAFAGIALLRPPAIAALCPTVLKFCRC